MKRIHLRLHAPEWFRTATGPRSQRPDLRDRPGASATRVRRSDALRAGTSRGPGEVRTATGPRSQRPDLRDKPGTSATRVRRSDALRAGTSRGPGEVRTATGPRSQRPDLRDKPGTSATRVRRSDALRAGTSRGPGEVRTATGPRSQRPDLRDKPGTSATRVRRSDALRAGTSRGPGAATRIAALALLVLAIQFASFGAESGASAGGAPAWKNGLPADENYFPIAVWLQDVRNAARFQAAGINLYVGLWRGPTTNQLAALQQAGMSVICAQNRTALEHKDHPSIVGWMHDDEPDNAQSLGEGKGYGPPILPERIQRDYERMRVADPTRPILLNLGQGVAWDDYIGRGVRRNRPEDYPEYVKGCDIASFDIYPAVHDHPSVAGKLEFVARGVERLRGWAGNARTVWNCIECTHISNERIKATPAQVRSEVWMALIRGSRGLIYFVHQFKPVFREAALLDDAEMLAGVTAINRRIRELAPVLNSPSVLDGVSVTSSVEGVPIAWMMKRRGATDYVFAVNLRNQPTRGTFTFRSTGGALEGGVISVLDESRTLMVEQGSFTDAFETYAVHLYERRSKE